MRLTGRKVKCCCRIVADRPASSTFVARCREQLPNCIIQRGPYSLSVGRGFFCCSSQLRPDWWAVDPDGPPPSAAREARLRFPEIQAQSAILVGLTYLYVVRAPPGQWIYMREYTLFLSG